MNFATLTLIVTPILKKPSLDRAVYDNYRPISNLPFLSKILLISKSFIKMQNYLHTHLISDIFQSGFNALHSTESALLNVGDTGDTIALVLLDLS